MRKINLKDYQIKVKILNEEEDKVELIEQPYSVKRSCVDLLTHPDLQLGGSELLEANKLAVKIESYKGDSILLEEEEYQKLHTVVTTLKGFTKKDVEFVERILEAKEVDVNEDK